MRIFALLLMLMVVLHSACMGQCLGQQSSAEPPCHHQKETPKQDFNLCSEGPALAAKSSPVVKCALDLMGVPCVVPALVTAPSTTWQVEAAFLFESVSPPLLQFTVLRI